MKNLTKITAGLLLFALIIASCKKDDMDKALSACIDEQIMKIENNEIENPPRIIWEWKVDGKTYYYYTAECCDQFNYLFDNNCNMICAPDGGIAGTGHGECPEFIGEVEETLIWEKD